MRASASGSWRSCFGSSRRCGRGVRALRARRLKNARAAPRAASLRRPPPSRRAAPTSLTPFRPCPPTPGRQLPQFISNFKNKSAEALSPWFLAQWLLGDTFNLTGALMQGQQLPTTTYTAM
jgi:hypothetical protein